MKKTILIGEKLTKKGVVKNYLLLSFYSILALFGYKGLISSYLHLPTHLDILVMVMIFILVLLFLTPIIATTTECIEFSQEEIRYFHVKGYFQQYAEVLRTVVGKQSFPDIVLKTKDIRMVNLSYTSFLMAWAQKGYQLKMTFLMEDGTVITLFPTSIDQMQNGDYELALQILENAGTQIKDKFHLRDALSHKNKFYELVDSIEKGQQKQ